MTIKEVQNHITEILVVVTELCDQFGIEYFLIGGGCLGIVRHKNSFIPWDDDLDIAIFAEDMNAFLAAMMLLPEQYKVQQGETLYSICKIFDSRTLVYRKRERDAIPENNKLGIFIDVIPMMAWSSCGFKRLEAILNLLCTSHKSRSLIAWKRTLKNLLYYIPVIRQVFAPLYEFVTRFSLQQSISLRKKKKGIITGAIGANWKGKYPWDVIFPVQEAIFNGVKVKVPSDLQTFLLLRYGNNYMNIPAHSERWNHFDKAYRLVD